MNESNAYDCIVMGGGPAGATTATVLADHGRRVLLLEKARFPRHHIGESLMAQTYWTLKRIGMLDKLRATDFPLKESVQFISHTGKESQPFYFADRDPNEWSITWQVRRDRFDRMMLDNAREHGVEVREGVQVRQVIFDGDRAVGVRVVEKPDSALPSEPRTLARADIRKESSPRAGVGTSGSSPGEYRAKVIVDATGQAAILSRQLNLRYPDEKLKHAAIYAYYKNAWRDAGRNAGATLVIRTPTRDGWFWFIPLDDNVNSVGVVAPPTHLCAGRGDDPLATLEDEIAATPALARRLEQAERVSGAYVTSDFSWRSRQVVGDGWVMVGDAFGFLDPLYSSGVLLALKSGELAADAIHEALQAGDVSADRLGKHAHLVAQGMQLIRQLVYAYYDQNFSFGDFLRAHPQYHDAIVRVLIGDVFGEPRTPALDDASCCQGSVRAEFRLGGLEEMFDCLGRYVDLPEAIRLEGLGRAATV